MYSVIKLSPISLGFIGTKQFEELYCFKCGKLKCSNIVVIIIIITTTTLYFPLLEYYFHIIEYKNN